MTENPDYAKTLAETLSIRADWLEKSELPKLKEELRLFHTGFTSLYHIFLKKKLIHEDPYKQEAKIVELEVPKSTPFTEAEKLDQLTQRLANYDNQLDFLVNFYQFSPEFLNLERIKRILGLVRYIDWIHLTPDSQNPMTKAVADMTNQIKIGTDPLTMSVISESISSLNKSINPIMGYLKILSDYQRECYKLDLRDITAGMSQADIANQVLLRKKLVQTKPGFPCYPDLVGEIIREDYSQEGPELRNEVLKKLQVAENKPKIEKAKVCFKGILIDGILTLGSTAGSFSDISTKLDNNQILLENKKKTFMQKIKKVVQQMLNKEPDPVIYDIEYTDPIKNLPVREKVNYNSFRTDLDRKTRILMSMASRGPAVAKLESMQEEQLVGFLERNIREIQTMHKTLGAMDDFFKAEVDKEDRDKVRGIRPELGTVKNAILKANARRHEYNSQKEGEEQLRRLGATPRA